MRNIRVACAAAVLALAVWPAMAADMGTSAEAKAMLEKVVTGLKANEAQTLAAINKGDFKDRDLYPFCGGPDGKYTAHGANPSLVGQDLKGLMDKATPPKPLGQEIYAAGQPGKIAEVSYTWVKPKDVDPDQKPVGKVSYITKVGDQVCGVGYYKP
jgi:signal transduction histidine kinase